MPLIDSDTWESKFIVLNQLHFHPANPRLPELRGLASEREIIHALCNHGAIEPLARRISEKDYFRNDRLIVLKENKRNIVYEGNRRLCALKVLDRPEMAPPRMLRTFRRLSERARLPRRIAVDVVPSKFDAEIVMYSKHAGGSFVVGWDPIPQATFIASKLDQGESIDEVCQSYGLKREEVIDARASIELYRLSRLASLTPAAQKLVDDPALFPYSTVYERLFKPKKSREALGAEIGENGLIINSTEENFLPVLARILDDAARDEINTRELGTEDDQRDYVSKLGFSPGGGRITADESERIRKTDDARQSPTSATPSNSAKQRPAAPDGRLLPKSLVIEYQHEKLSRLIDEAKKLEIAFFPHASAYLLRSLLEIALTVKLKMLKLYSDVFRTAKSTKLGPSLAEMLDYVNHNHQKIGLDPNAKIALEALISRAVKQSKPQLDRIVHGPDVLTHKEEVTAIREQALPLLRVLLSLNK